MLFTDPRPSTRPSQITFSADGMKLIVACEGEPSTQDLLGSDPNTGSNPSGAVAVVSVTWNMMTGLPSLSGVNLLDFQAYFDKLSTSEYAKLLDNGLKIDPRVNGKERAAVDIEPEYIALSDDGMKAYVTLQVGKS